MKRLVVMAVLVGLAVSAQAASKKVTLGWLNPLTDEAGTALELTDIKQYVVAYSKKADMTDAQVVTVPAITTDPDGDGDVPHQAQIILGSSGWWHITVYAVDTADRDGIQWQPYLKEKVTGKPGSVRQLATTAVEVVD